MSDWRRIDSPAEAVALLDLEIQRSADEAFEHVVDLPEDDRRAAMAQVWAILDQVREHNLVEIAKAFTCIKTVH